MKMFCVVAPLSCTMHQVQEHPMGVIPSRDPFEGPDILLAVHRAREVQLWGLPV